MSILEAEQLDVQFTNWRRKVTGHPIAGVSFVIEENESVGIIGDHGSGKTVLAKALCGLVRFSGNLQVNNHPVRYPFGKQVYREIQGIFSGPEMVFDPFRSVRQSTEDLLRSVGCSKAEIGSMADGAFDLAGISQDVQRARIAELDHDSAMCCAVARACAVSPKLLICDDIMRTADDKVLQVIKRIVEARGIQVLFLSRFPKAALELCSRVLVLYQGTIVEEVGKDHSEPEHPYARMLWEMEQIPAGHVLN